MKIYSVPRGLLSAWHVLSNLILKKALRVIIKRAQLLLWVKLLAQGHTLDANICLEFGGKD